MAHPDRPAGPDRYCIPHCAPLLNRQSKISAACPGRSLFDLRGHLGYPRQAKANPAPFPACPAREAIPHSQRSETLVIQLVLAVVCAIVVSAMCSVFEAVLYSLPVSNVELMAKRHPRRAAKMKQLKENIDRPITAILTLNTIANTIGAAVAGASAVAVFGDSSLAWFSLLFTLAILLFSEILPKKIGVIYSRQLAPLITLPLHWMVRILSPVIWLCQAITRLVPDSGDANQVSAEELQTIAMLSRRSGEIGAEQEKVITNILQLNHKSVRDVMTPRTVTFSLDMRTTIRQAIALADNWRMHSRVPVYDGDKDNVVGMVLSREMFMAAAENRYDTRLSEIMAPVHFVPETAPLNRVFIDFFERRQHLFVAVDEYGSVTGVISMEDIIEEIMGREIVDESDTTRDMRELARIRRKKLRRQEGGNSPS